MVMAGPRALQRLGEDYVGLSWLGSTNTYGLPRNAIVLMGAIALFFLWTSTFEQILLFAGLVMATNTLFTVMAVFVSRARRKREAQQSEFTIPFYPLPAIIFLSITGWTVLYTAVQYPFQLAITLGLIVAGYPLFRLLERRVA